MRTALLALALLLPAAARAQPTLSLRVAYAAALGEAADEVPMGDAVQGQLPLQLDALWRFGRVAAGAYVSWGVGQVSSGACGGGADCSASALRLGLQGTYAFGHRRLGEIAPWGGVGFGWEWATQRRERLGSETTYTWRGPEGLVQGGVDWPITRRLAIGPFVQLAVGRYTDLSLDTSAASASAEIGGKATHAWVHVGVRGKLDLDL